MIGTVKTRPGVTEPRERMCPSIFFKEVRSLRGALFDERAALFRKQPTEKTRDKGEVNCAHLIDSSSL